MALVVEDGTGLSTAESYLTIADISTYLTKYGDATAFDALASDALREEAARKATRFLDAEFRPRWKGARKLGTQAIDWPRTDVYDRDEYLIDEDSLPAALTDATAVLANASLTDTLMPDQAKPGAIKRTRIKAGAVEKETEYAGAQVQEKLYRLAEALLGDLIESGSTLARA